MSRRSSHASRQLLHWLGTGLPAEAGRATPTSYLPTTIQLYEYHTIYLPSIPLAYSRDLLRVALPCS